MTINITNKKWIPFLLGILAIIIIIFSQSQKINFWLTTQIVLPGSASDIRHYSHVGGMGDGEDELTFKVSKDDTAETEGFEPSRPFTACLVSSEVPSTSSATSP